MKNLNPFKSLILTSVMLSFLLSGIYAQQKVSFDSPPAAKQPRNPKVAPVLDYMINYYKALPKQEQKAFTELKKSPLKINNLPCLITKDGYIQVYIYLNNLSEDAIKDLEKSGAKVQLKSEKRVLVQALIPMDKIDDISAKGNISLVALPSYGLSNIGPVTTEADMVQLLNTWTARQPKDPKHPEYLGISAATVCVGVMSDGINYFYNSVRQGDIKTTPTAKSFINYPDNDDSYLTVGSEGTAMMEIISDLAPDCALQFSNFGTDLEMNMSKDWLAESITYPAPSQDHKIGCNILVDDISFFTAGPLDGNSELSLKNGELVAKGIAYYTSVGNHAQYHYLGKFNDSHKPNGIHEFAYDAITKKADETLECTLDDGYSARVLLQWDQDDPSGAWTSTDDIDLYLLDSSTLDWNNPIYVSATIQNGQTPPYEFLVPTQGGDYSIGIRRKNPNYTEAKRFHLFLIPFSNIEYKVTNGSILNNNDAGGGCISVGAIDVSVPGRKIVEDFSSQGPTDDGRLKPEISCYDGVKTSVSGFNPFYGTSASAPHVAGVAALMLGTISTMPPDEVSSYMRLFATDLYETGDDYISGSGRLEGYVMLDFLSDVAAGASALRKRTYAFNRDEELWLPQVVAGLAPPTFSYESGSLTVKSINNTNCYGSYVSPTVEFLNTPTGMNTTALVAGKVYEAKFTIRCDASATEFPSFRLRIGSKNNAAIVSKVYNSVTGNQESPGAAGKSYSVYMIPPASTIMDGIYVAFDLMNFDITDKADAKFYIDDVTLYERNLPSN